MDASGSEQSQPKDVGELRDCQNVGEEISATLIDENIVNDDALSSQHVVDSNIESSLLIERKEESAEQRQRGSGVHPVKMRGKRVWCKADTFLFFRLPRPGVALPGPLVRIASGS